MTLFIFSILALIGFLFMYSFITSLQNKDTAEHKIIASVMFVILFLWFIYMNY